MLPGMSEQVGGTPAGDQDAERPGGRRRLRKE